MGMCGLVSGGINMANTYSLDLESGSSQYVKITDAAQTGLAFSSTFTLEGWFNFESLPASNGNMGFANKSKSDGSDYAYAWYLNHNADPDEYRLTLYCMESADATKYDSAYWVITPSTGVWYHYAVTCDVGNASATTFELFINGVSPGNGTMARTDNCTSIHDSAMNFEIGTPWNATATEFFDGKIDDFRAWNDVRTSVEIASNMNHQLVGNETGLVGYWKLNNDYLDETTNNNDLTASGSPVFSTDVPFTEAGFLPIL